MKLVYLNIDKGENKFFPGENFSLVTKTLNYAATKFWIEYLKTPPYALLFVHYAKRLYTQDVLSP